MMNYLVDMLYAHPKQAMKPVLWKLTNPPEVEEAPCLESN